ncbi:MAG: thioesterase domain-containing protein [Roseivirga sp.]
MIYHPWKNKLGDDIELRPIELAGRGRRINDVPYQNLEEVVDDISTQIREEILESPYMLFGHSLGAIIAYELARKAREENLPRPRHLFFSGKGAMHIERPEEKKYHLMDNEKFKKEILELGGTPLEFFEYPELMELFLPLLKSDFKIAETYSLNGDIRPFDQEITVLLGKADDLNDAQCTEWQQHTTKTCHFQYFPGGHFFINDEQEKIVQIIRDVVAQDTHSAYSTPQ